MPDEDSAVNVDVDSSETTPFEPSPEENGGVDDDEVTVEEIPDKADPAVDPSPKMKSVVVEEWLRLNSQPPLWMRQVQRLMGLYVC